MYTADWRWTHNVGEREREELALCVAQACERKNCTVNSTRGTTWVGVTSVDEQVGRQWLGQHWFITEYIAAYIQGLYTVYKGARVQGAVANWFDY
jgi:hypothetical protein